MKLRKTDQRFSLAKEGFTCFLEFNSDDWNNYYRWEQQCRKSLGNPYWSFGRYHQGGPGQWKSVFRHRKRNGKETSRIYLRGDKVYTLLSLAIPAESDDIFYL